MSKNVLITEGRRGRRFGNVKKLKTALQGGGSCLWVPEDDVQLESLFAVENGVYRPDEYGFSEASIHVVDGNIGMLNADDNLAYVPGGDLNGYGKVNVDVPENKQRNFSDIIQIGTYNDPSKPYLFTFFSSKSGSGSTLNYSARETVTYESKYPAYFVEENGATYFALFARGPSCIRVHIDWESHASSSAQGSGVVSHAYLKCAFELNTEEYDSTGGRILGSEYTGIVPEEIPGELKYIGTPKFNVGYHCGLGGVTFTRQNDTACSKTSLNSYHIGWYGIDNGSTARWIQGRGATDYRVIKGEPFQSEQEYLAWCKTH